MVERMMYSLPGGRALKLGVMGIFLAVVLAVAAPDEADAAPLSVDSDGYVPVYSTCVAGSQLGFYNWNWDGYETAGYILVNDCALQSYGAGPMDRQRVIAHERGHAVGLPHSSNPSSVMYPVITISGQ